MHGLRKCFQRGLEIRSRIDSSCVSRISSEGHAKGEQLSRSSLANLQQGSAWVSCAPSYKGEAWKSHSEEAFAFGQRFGYKKNFVSESLPIPA